MSSQTPVTPRFDYLLVGRGLLEFKGFRRTLMPQRPHRACVVSAGFGGLSAAIRLQAMGFATTLFEARDKAGGRAYVLPHEDARRGATHDAPT